MPVSPVPGQDGKATSGAHEPLARDLIARALANGTIDRATSLAYRGMALVGDPRLPVAYQGAPGADPTFFLDARFGNLTAAEREAVMPYVVRPNHPASVYSDTSGYTIQTHRPVSGVTYSPLQPGEVPCVHGWANLSSSTHPFRVWTFCGRDDYYYGPGYESKRADTAQRLREAVAAWDALWGPMTKMMGDVIPDERDVWDEANAFAGQTTTGAQGVNEDVNPDSRVDLYLASQSSRSSVEGTYLNRFDESTQRVGLTLPTLPELGKRTSSYMIIDPSTVGSPRFKSILAHEFFHVLQNTQNAFTARGCTGHVCQEEYWFAEASATWAQSHFARDTAKDAVYVRYPAFQADTVGLNDPRMSYKGFTWPYFMEQEIGTDAIAAAWFGIALADSWEEFDQALDDQLSFADHVGAFALRNLDSELEGKSPVRPQHWALDANFTKGSLPPMDDAVVRVAPSQFFVDVAHLRASYLHVRTDLPQMELDISGLSPLAKAKVVAVERHHDGTWSVNELETPKATLCDVDEAWIAIVNAGWKQADPSLSGGYQIRGINAKCSCTSAAEVKNWTATLDVTFDFTHAWTSGDVDWKAKFHHDGTARATLGKDARGRWFGTPTGHAKIADIVESTPRSGGGTSTMQVDYDGPLGKREIVSLALDPIGCTFSLNTQLEGQGGGTGTRPDRHVADLSTPTRPIPRSLHASYHEALPAGPRVGVGSFRLPSDWTGYELPAASAHDDYGTALVTWTLAPAEAK